MDEKRKTQETNGAATLVGLDDLVTEVEVALRLGVSTKTIKNRIASGIFPMPVRLPGSNRSYFLRAELDAWIGEHIARRPEIGEDPRSPQRKGRKTKAQARVERLAGGGA